ncbi:MAG: hypothetical protein RIB45_03030 [Marivibrio sp.]|uniref:hypothetical protein n=1 Tax=Marivibrio sp. TaxID=2039719 RepID=UPI0032ED7FEC
MEGQIALNEEMSFHLIAQLVLLGLIFLVCLWGMVLHVFALRHRKPGVPIFGYKDSLLKRAEERFTEEGMKYVEQQKRLVVVAMILVVLLVVASMPDS